MRCILACWLIAATLALPLVLCDEDSHMGHVQEVYCDKIVISSGKKFVDNKTDPQAYIECVSLGWGIYKACDNATHFNISQQACVQDEPEDNSTTTIQPHEMSNSTPEEGAITSTVDPITSITEGSGAMRNARFANFFRVVKVQPVVGIKISTGPIKMSCNGSDSCINGVCDEWSNGTKCICLVSFSGSFCENNAVQSGSSLQERIQNDSFDLSQYLAQEFGKVPALAVPAIPAVAPSTVAAKPNLLDMSANNVTYNTFATHLVNQLWLDINQEGAVLKAANFGQIHASDKAPEDLQRARFYSRYVLFNIDSELRQLEASLDHLAKRYGNSSVKLNAIQEVENVHSGSVDVPIEVHTHDFNKTMHVAAIKVSLNQTLCRANKLYAMYVAQMSNDSSAVVYTAEQQSGFVADMHNSAASNWNMVVEYGVQYFSTKLSGNQVVVPAGGEPAKGVLGKRSARSVFQARKLEEN